MTIEEIRKNAPDGATHYDGMDYWREFQEKWFIWIPTAKQWRKIFNYKKFHEQFPIKPL
ncbi:MAG: hypothetical protein RR676_11475 [Acinetobacter sp.]